MSLYKNIQPFFYRGNNILKNCYTAIKSVRNIGGVNIMQSEQQQRNQSSIVDSAGTNNRVLSIQSHVVHGYVGNKSATFPLQVSV